MKQRSRLNTMKQPPRVSVSLGLSGYLAAGVLLLAGCQSIPTKAPGDTRQNVLTAEISSFLSDAAVGEQRRFEASPWGAPVTITAEQAYFAASGRPCRPLAITSSSLDQAPGLACRSNNGWEWVRPITR